MRKGSRIIGLISFVGILILIMDGKTAVYGIVEGIELCLRTIIPSLLPFIFLSNILIDALLGSDLKILKLFGSLFHIPHGAESFLIPAFLGGYPTAVQSIAQANRKGYLSKSTGEWLISFMNNAGPSFIFGVLFQSFPELKIRCLIWILQILGAIIASNWITYEYSACRLDSSNQLSISESLETSLATISKICGWVVLFRMLIAFLDRWILWVFPMPIKIAFIGFLELSNGCCLLKNIESMNLRFLLANIMLSFGGLCVTLQTISVAEPLSMRMYFHGKAIQIAVVGILAILYCYSGWLGIMIPFCLILLAARNKAKKSSILPELRV